MQLIDIQFLQNSILQNPYIVSIRVLFMPVKRHMVKVTPGRGYKRPVPEHYRHHSRKRPAGYRGKNY
jgi:hypothetical protein